MIQLQTELEGKTVYFGELQNRIASLGYTVGSNKDNKQGSLDYILSKDDRETIYLRIPFVVTQGTFHEYEPHIKFQAPYVIKNVRNVDVDQDECIVNKNRWEHAGKEAVEKVVRLVQ